MNGFAFAVSRLWGMRYSVTIGIVLGIFVGLSNDSIEDAVLAAYDSFFPVVTTNVHIVSATKDEVIISVSGVKNRACEFKRSPHAEGRTSGGSPVEMVISRLDRPEYGATRPVGPFAAGTWIIWPRGTAASVQVYVTHSCNGRIVTSKFADVELP